MRRRKDIVQSIKKTTTISNLLSIILLVIISTCISCRHLPAYYQYVNIAQEGMGKGDCLLLTPQINDSVTSYYDVTLHLRYDNNYPYTKLYLDITHSSLVAQGSTQHEILEIELNEGEASKRPQWEYIKQKAIPFKRHVSPGQNCTIAVKHLMNDAILPGLLNIGMEFTPSKE